MSPNRLIANKPSKHTMLSTPSSQIPRRTKPLRILVDSLADKALINAQMINAREIIRRLNPEKFHVSTFYVNEPDPLLVERPNTRLIHLPGHLQTIRIFREFVLGRHKILFYLKAAPASKWYLQLRHKGGGPSCCDWNCRKPI
jgi:hypothetical protein